MEEEIMVKETKNKKQDNDIENLYKIINEEGDDDFGVEELFRNQIENRKKNEEIEEETPDTYKSSKEQQEAKVFEKDKKILDDMRNQMAALFWEQKDEDALKLREQYYNEGKRIYKKLEGNYLRIASPFQKEINDINREIRSSWERKNDAMKRQDIKTLKDLILETEELTQKRKNSTKKLKDKTVKQRRRLQECEKYIREEDKMEQDYVEERDTLKLKRKRWLINLISKLGGENETIPIPSALIVNGPHIIGHFIKRDLERERKELSLSDDRDIKSERMNFLKSKEAVANRFNNINETFSASSTTGLFIKNLMPKEEDEIDDWSYEKYKIAA